MTCGAAAALGHVIDGYCDACGMAPVSAPKTVTDCVAVAGAPSVPGGGLGPRPCEPPRRRPPPHLDRGDDGASKARPAASSMSRPSDARRSRPSWSDPQVAGAQPLLPEPEVRGKRRSGGSATVSRDERGGTARMRHAVSFLPRWPRRPGRRAIRVSRLYRPGRHGMGLPRPSTVRLDRYVALKGVFTAATSRRRPPPWPSDASWPRSSIPNIVKIHNFVEHDG